MSKVNMQYRDSKLLGNIDGLQNRVMVGIPMTGLLRAEWVIARYGQVIPCNWSQTDAIRWLDTYSPLNYLVADARNSVVAGLIRQDFEWLLFIDHDVILPADFVLKMNEYIGNPVYPVVSGIYFTKSIPSEPLIYRGRGNSYYRDWKFGDKVEVDGLPMGCTLIHSSILKEMYKDSPEYNYKGETIRRVFETPRKSYHDPQTGGWYTASGTEDLEWCSRVIKEKYLQKAGWDEIAKKEYPFLIDTGIFCKHIEPNGRIYPANGEEANWAQP